MPIWLRSAIFTLVFPGTVAGVVPWLLITGSHRLPLCLGAARWSGLAPLVLGLGIYVATAWEFGFAGRGTPAPWDPPRNLVDTGLYAWVRNPMYVGVLLCILGEGMLWQAGILFPYAGVVWAVFHLRVLTYEEPVLRRTFGESFDAYRARVPRWVPWPHRRGRHAVQDRQNAVPGNARPPAPNSAPASPTPAALAVAADDNLAVHATWLLQHIRNARVEIGPDLVLADSGLPCDTFNFVCRTRLTAESAPARISDALSFFRQTGHPFSWWVGPGHSPAHLPDLLRQAGLEEAEGELAMALPLHQLRDAPTPPGLEIRRVATPQDLAAYARLSAASWSPPDPWVLQFYELGAPWLLAPASAQWLFVGLLEGVPVATAGLTFGGGVVGVYNIATAPAVRGRGIGTAMTHAPLRAAQRDGHMTAILQAAPDGIRIYERLGFREFGRITEFKPPPQAGSPSMP